MGIQSNLLASEARHPWLLWSGFKTVSGALRFALLVNGLAMISLARDWLPPFVTLLICTYALWFIHLAHRRERETASSV